MGSQEPPKKWQFWWPLAFWKVLLIFFLTNLAAHLFVAALREGLKLNVPIAVAGGLGAVLGIFIVNNLALKARAADKPRG